MLVVFAWMDSEDNKMTTLLGRVLWGLRIKENGIAYACNDFRQGRRFRFSDEKEYDAEP